MDGKWEKTFELTVDCSKNGISDLEKVCEEIVREAHATRLSA